MNNYQLKVENLKKRLEAVNIYITDPDVIRLLRIAKIIYSTKLDVMQPDELLRYGGTLSGLYISFGNKYSMARAEHEITENTYKQVSQKLQQAYLDQNDKYKVTEAKNLASSDLEDSGEDVILKESVYKQWETVMDTTKTLVMFIQSAMATKKTEAYINERVHNQNNQK